MACTATVNVRVLEDPTGPPRDHPLIGGESMSHSESSFDWNAHVVLDFALSTICDVVNDRAGSARRLGNVR